MLKIRKKKFKNFSKIKKLLEKPKRFGDPTAEGTTRKIKKCFSSSKFFLVFETHC